MWDGAPPGRAPDATRSLVMRLRRRLDQRAAARIVTRALDILHDIGEFWLTAFPLDHLGDQIMCVLGVSGAGTAVRDGQGVADGAGTGLPVPVDLVARAGRAPERGAGGELQ